MAIDFNTEPYYDDFNESKRFLRILYRPGYAVQARELTQMQSILQNQISRFGSHVFKEGSLVIPGEIGKDLAVGYIQLSSSYGNVLADSVIDKLIGLNVECVATGLQAQVIYYSKSEGADPSTLFVKYLNSGDSNVAKVFADSDVIRNMDGTNSLGETVSVGTYQVQTASSSSTGIGSLATVQQGVYYIKGHFVLVPAQTIVLDKYSNTPSYRIGLTTTESIVTAEDDTSLFDNAQSSFNYAAPGAHRYYIDAVLTKLSLTSTNDIDFIELLRLESGSVASIVTKTEYSYLEKEFAHRTYDESGDYTVKNFEIDVREYRNNNRGAWVTGRVYLAGDVVTNAGYTYVAQNSATSVNSTPPTHTAGYVYDGAVSGVGTTGIQWQYNPTPYYNRGVYAAATSGTDSTLSAQQAFAANIAVGLEPGKAYVQGYEIEKPSTEYLTVSKARDTLTVSNAVIPTTVGNYVLVTNINGAPPISTFAYNNNLFGQVVLYNRVTSAVGTIPSGATIVGYARARFMEYHNGTIGAQTAIYKLGLFDVQMTSGYDFKRDVKSFYHQGGTSSDTNLNFTADIEGSTAVGSGILTRLIGSATASASATITGTGTSFQTDLKVGDYVMLGTALRRVVTVSSQVQIIVDSVVTVTGATIDRVETKIYEPDSTSLLFPFPYYAINSITDTVYSVYETFTGTISAGAISVTTLSSPTGTMASAAQANNYTVIDCDATYGGAVLPATVTVTGSSASLNVGTSYNGRTVFVIAAVSKQGTTLTKKSKQLVTGYQPSAFTTAATAQPTQILLGKADGYRLVSVMMKSGTFASPGSTYSIDISDRYIWDDGQRSTHYDVARIILKNSYAPPEAPIQVTFDYFTHGTGDYFTKASYTDVPYESIPYFEGQALRDVVDFRPRINDAGTGFTGTGALMTLIPKRGIDISTDFSYYLARKTKIAVDLGGKFFAINGTSSLSPGEPSDPSLGLTLYNLTLEPYTFGTTTRNIQVNRIDNKRYTMRDIGKLEKRIDNLEYYTSLSLLEQQTESLNITDSTGINRFKNGFIVDNFSGHNTGDSTSPDYLCAIDMERAELRPFYSMQNVNLIENASSDATRSGANYKLYGDVITLPVVDNIAIVTQQYASRLENINPFAVFTFLGDVKINPSSDDWFETDRRPDIVVDLEGNFTTIKNLAEKAGVLGTVWNAWQTQWTGAAINTGQVKYTTGGNWASHMGDVYLTQAELQAKFGITSWGNARQITVSSTATQVSQSRTGVKTTLVERIDRQVVGDRVLSTAAIPYIRSRNILVQIQKLKPNTRFYPFFDGIDISAYCTPATKIEYNPAGTLATAKAITHNKFDIDTNVGSKATDTERRISTDSQACLNRGDVISNGSGATAVVVGKEYNSDTGIYALYVLNVVGTFATNDTITASNPLGYAVAASGTVGTVTSKSLASTLISNVNGDLQLLFNIPNNDSLRFRCGTRELKLVDVTTANGDFTSRARANYTAQGILETKQRTVNSVRNGELAQEPLQENQVITQTSERIVADTGWWDPLAQTFLVTQAGGCFLSKVDIFFATKDTAVPVTLEIREVVNGYPGKRVLPFSRVTLKPEYVNTSLNTVNLDGVDVSTFDTATSFTFPSPVYVQENTEYAIILASDSNNYKVWVSKVGDTVPGTSRTISEQPYLGSLFKSQNASTWTADQTEDLKFTVYRCQFATNTNAAVSYVNDALPKFTLDSDPFETRKDVTKVRVWHANHGIPSGSKVTISGVTANVNGIAFAGFNNTFTISDVDLDSYCITLGSAATSTGYSGGSAVRATRHIQYDAVQPLVQMQTFSDTSVAVTLKGVSGKSVDSSSQSAYTIDSTGKPVLINETNYFSSPKMIASEQNEANSDLTNGLNGAHSVTLNIAMSTTNDALSPIIDTHRTSLIAINNKVNSPTADNLNVASLDDNVLLSNATGVTISGSTITTSTQNAAFLTATVGKYLTIAGASTGTSTKLIMSIASDGSSITFDSAPTAVTGNVTLTERERFVDESAPFEGSTYSKYVTKKITLSNNSTYLRVKFAANLPKDAAIEVWYKTNIVGSSIPFESVSYTKLTVDSPILNSLNEENQFYDASYSLSNMTAYDAIQIKLVMKSVNSSQVPRVKDLRIIACA